MLAEEGYIKREGPNDNFDESSSDSSPYIIKAKTRRYAGSFAANNRTFENLERPKYEIKQSFKNFQSEVKRGAKKEETGLELDAAEGMFDEKFKRRFVFSILEKLGEDQEDHSLNILRK